MAREGIRVTTQGWKPTVGAFGFIVARAGDDVDELVMSQRPYVRARDRLTAAYGYLGTWDGVDTTAMGLGRVSYVGTDRHRQLEVRYVPVPDHLVEACLLHLGCEEIASRDRCMNTWTMR